MLGGEPAVDYSLANRSLLFDLDRRGLVRRAAGGQRSGPRQAAHGRAVGHARWAAVSAVAAAELGLSARHPHRGRGARPVRQRRGLRRDRARGTPCYGMGTYLCIVPVLARRPAPAGCWSIGLNTEHHAVPGRFVSFIYNRAARW